MRHKQYSGSSDAAVAQPSHRPDTESAQNSPPTPDTTRCDLLTFEEAGAWLGLDRLG